MKKIKIMLLVTVALMVAIFTGTAGTFQLVNGYSYTNGTVLYNGVTNQIGVVLGATTNYFNLPTAPNISSGGGVISDFSNTNKWPAAMFVLMGYPNTLYGPSKTVLLNNIITLTATNATSTPIQVRYAGWDGNNWVSNAITVGVTIAVNTTSASVQTNAATGGYQALALQQVDNPGAAAVTNQISNASTLPGF